MTSAHSPGEPPIQNLDQIDIVRQREDGKIDLFIVASSELTGSPEHQDLLLAKIESYLEQLNSSDFKAEFNHPRPDQVTIMLVSDHPIDPVIYQLMKNAQPWVEANNARLSLDNDNAGATG